MKPDETTPAFIGNPIREADGRLAAKQAAEVHAEPRLVTCPQCEGCGSIEETGGFTCDCCGRNTELRVDGKWCNECAGSRARSTSTVAQPAENAATLLFDEGCRAVTLTGKDYWAIPRETYDKLRVALASEFQPSPHCCVGGLFCDTSGLDLTDEEVDAIGGLAVKQDLSASKIIKQALRV